MGRLDKLQLNSINSLYNVALCFSSPNIFGNGVDSIIFDSTKFFFIIPKNFKLKPAG